ncbi:MAG: ATP-binding protein [Candidatus Electrothrix sp. AR3]|nr:ATP-binding protein [Candidatus Electrothrix sp. AR3]
MEKVKITIPNKFSFTDYGTHTFNHILSIFDWSLKDMTVTIDFSCCFKANYQALSILTLYIWHLRTNDCYINFQFSDKMHGASQMWNFMGAKGWHHVLINESKNFYGNVYKPLIAIRNSKDFTLALSKTESYTKKIHVEFKKTLRYVISELLYNTLEHGKKIIHKNSKTTKIPSIIQLTWYKNKKQLQLIVADTGIGIKKHMERNYPPFESDEDAILHSLKHQASGTFGKNDPYKSKDNVGVGLSMSSNIVQKLNGDMHIVSQNGLVHVSPTDKTTKSLTSTWPGTLVLVSLNLGQNLDITLHKLIPEIQPIELRKIGVISSRSTTKAGRSTMGQSAG